MDNKHYLSKLHKDILTIMDEIDRICKAYNIKYYLVGGTLLGAIRHHGFIPWDDDLDIAMPRDDMEKFLSIAKSELSSQFYIEWISTNEKYWQFFPKVCLKNTIFEERYVKKAKPTGIFVDIFPLDYSPAYCSYTEKKRSIIKKLIGYLQRRVAGGFTIKYFYDPLLRHLLSPKYVFKVMDKITKSVAKHGQTHFANFGSQYRLSKQTMPIEWYGNGVTVDFEGHSYKAPAEYIKVLTSVFGDNFMQIPPSNKRRCHYPSSVKFSDGEVLTFEKPSEIVEVEV